MKKVLARILTVIIIQALAYWIYKHLGFEVTVIILLTHIGLHLNTIGELLNEPN
jgi:hypothetical protein